jgi:hypothetical protein
VFDDERVGLKGEPFVGEINTMIDYMLRDARIRNGESGFTAYFSPTPLPGAHMILKHVEGKAQSGTTYACPQYQLEGWLCPALSRYFSESPAYIYVRAEEIRTTFWQKLRRLIGL